MLSLNMLKSLNIMPSKSEEEKSKEMIEEELIQELESGNLKYPVLKNIVDKLIEFIPNQQILNKNVLKDLEIFQSNDNIDSNTVFDKINKTYTITGSKILENIISNPTNNLNLLKERQNIVKKIIDNDPLKEFLKDQLKELSKLEKTLLWLWNDVQQETEELYSMVYINNNFFKIFNNNEFFLQIINVYKIFISPGIYLLSPILAVVMPFIVIRLYGIKINVKTYLKLMKVVMLNPGGMYSGLSGGGLSKYLSPKMMRLISIMVWVVFFFQGLYSTITLSLKINRVCNIIHSKLNNISKYVNICLKINNRLTVENFNYPSIQIDKNQCSSDLEYQLSRNVFKRNPNLFSKKGAILKVFNLVRNNKILLKPYLEYVGKVDAYYSIFTLINENNKGYCFAEYLESSIPTIELEETWHPCLDYGKVVKNNIDLNKSNMIITGPNAGGKSTVIKSSAISCLFAQSLGISNSKSCKITPFKVINTYINIPDCKGKESLFEAEMKRCLEHIDCVKKLDKNEFSFIVMDEIFTGTNMEEGLSAAYSVCKKFTNFSNNITIITTHFKKLTELEKDTKGKFKNYKVTIDRDDEGQIMYNYNLVKGITNQYIAIELLKNKGFDDDVISEAINIKNQLLVSNAFKNKKDKEEHIKENEIENDKRKEDESSINSNNSDINNNENKIQEEVEVN